MLTQNSALPHSAFLNCWVAVSVVLTTFYAQISKVLEHSLIHVELTEQVEAIKTMDLL